MEGDVISAQEIFRFRRQGVSNDGVVVGRFEATGVRPGFTDRLRVAGVELPASLFSSM
jgi:pilus assembly protein CpaF